MIWIFILAVGLALVLIKLGALSVWVSIMAIGLKITLLIILSMAVVFFVKRFLFNSKSKQIRTLK